MPDNGQPLSFEEVQQLFDTLGVKNFGADLAEGRAFWTDEGGRIVASGRCQAILSFAPANQSVAWASAIPAFQDAGVPCIEPLDDAQPFLEDVDQAEAEDLARQACQLTSAQFLYESTSGPSTLYLAIRDFQAGEADGADLDHRVSAATAWAGERLAVLADLLQAGETTKAASLLRAFAKGARNQAEMVVPGTDLAPRLAGLATQAMMWSDLLPAQADQVAYGLQVAARGFAERN